MVRVNDNCVFRVRSNEQGKGLEAYAIAMDGVFYENEVYEQAENWNDQQQQYHAPPLPTEPLPAAREYQHAPFDPVQAAYHAGLAQAHAFHTSAGANQAQPVAVKSSGRYQMPMFGKKISTPVVSEVAEEDLGGTIDLDDLDSDEDDKQESKLVVSKAKGPLGRILKQMNVDDPTVDLDSDDSDVEMADDDYVGEIKKTKRSGVLFRVLTRALGAHIEREFCIGPDFGKIQDFFQFSCSQFLLRIFKIRLGHA
jgi:hypothetical protein